MLDLNFNLSSLNDFPDLCVWKKDLSLRFVDLNDTAAQVFGFIDRKKAIGKSDYEIPSGLSNFANTFREHDTKVINSAGLLKFLEIQPCANQEWKILHVVKTPYYEKGKIAGVMGYSADITKTFMKLEQFFMGNVKNRERYSAVLPKAYDGPKLTLRESECLFFLLRKATAKEIAGYLHLSNRTIEYYIEMLKSKFSCDSKMELIQAANKLGYFNIIPPSIMQKQLSIQIE